MLTLFVVTVLVLDSLTQRGVKPNHCISESNPCRVFTLSVSYNISSFQPVVDHLRLLLFHLRVVDLDLLQGRHAYPKTQAQGLNVRDGIKLGDNLLQIILIYRERLHIQ